MNIVRAHCARAIKPFLIALGIATLPGTVLAARPPADVDAARLAAADSEPQNWFTGGRDGSGSYYSPLKGIDAGNVGRLGFAWEYDLSTIRGQEATPIVIDGVMYTSGASGFVYAVDAATGKELWRFIPELDNLYMRHPCCDMVNRGVSVWKGRVYVASVDGHLRALDAATGHQLWDADTFVDRKLPYSITGAPQVAGDVVVIGNGGADMGHIAVRGYVSAYDLASGALKWRFWTVPPAPGKPYENPELAAADRSWDATRPPEFHGGGTVWDGLAYDPALNLVYLGTANAAPYDLRQLGSGHLDSLYAASIIALHADTGRMAWYYQTTPRDMWDFDATQKFVLTDLAIGGKSRPVIMQANKNGFFYVLDRRSGKLLSANSFTYVNWASRVDARTGRPVVKPEADWNAQPKTVYPSWFGAHTWNPMSWNPQTHLAYIPVNDVPAVWVDLLHNGGSVRYLDGFFTVNGVVADDTYDAADLKHLFGPLPSMDSIRAGRPEKPVRELLRAFDPVKGRTVWEVETSAGVRGYDGGIMSTASNLVFQGRGSGELWAYAADTGKVLAKIPTGSHIMAAPMTYEVNGEQYVAVQVGYGGTGISVNPIPPASAAYAHENVNRIIAFRLGGGAVPEPAARDEGRFPSPPVQRASAAHVQAGEVLFVQECSRCHVFGPSVTPDLRRLSPGLHDAFSEIVLHGLLAPAGMERFDDILSEQDVDDIHAYIIDQSWAAWKAQQPAGASHAQ